MDNWVYIIWSAAFDKYYIGQTQNVRARLDRHNKGYEKSTSPYVPWELVWMAAKDTRGDAMTLERKLKNLSKVRIREFIIRHGDGSERTRNYCMDG